jgi:exosortase N
MDKEFINSKAFRYWLIGISFLVFLYLSYDKLSFYVRFDFNFILLLLALPFVIKKEDVNKSIRYGIAALFFLLLYFFLRLSSVYFLAFICTWFFLYESMYGKLNILPLFMVVIASPVVIFVSEMLGFEIRLTLTKLAAHSLNLINDNYKSVGNIIVIKDKEFHVDPVCMGLKMVIVSFYSSLIIISFFQKRYNVKYKIISIIAALTITYLLVIISNFFRIILITLFNIEAETFAHEFAGILCFIVYVILPLYFIIKNLPVKKNDIADNTNNKAFNYNYVYILIILISGLMLYYKLYPEDLSKKQTVNINDTELNSGKYRYSIEELNVIKLTSKDLLIYIKPATSFYSAEHSPIICWKGCGYKVEKEQVISLNGQEIYFSELRYNNALLYSCWWYDSGNDKTISQVAWRSRSLIRNRDYHLINLISYNKLILFNETKKMLKKDIFL